jgi:VWFA-related protein
MYRKYFIFHPSLSAIKDTARLQLYQILQLQEAGMLGIPVPFMRKIATIRLMWQKTFALAVLASLFAVQSRPATQDSTSPDFSVSVNLVKVPLSVFDSQGNLVTALRSQDFRIWEDQAPQQIRSFGLDTNPVSVVLLLDTSMSEKTEMKKTKEAAEEFVDALSSGDRFSLVTFDDQVYRALDWTDSAKKMRRVLGKISPGWRTALYDAMYFAANDQLKGIDGRKAIILLTDCLNNQSSVDFHDASLAIVQSQASLYVVSKTAMVREQAKHERRVVMLTDIYKRLFGSDDDYIDEFFRKREAEMTGLAERTGGRCFFPTDYDQIKDVYEEVARELKSKYFLTYVSNQNLLPDSYHRISIEYLAPASSVIYRKGYYYRPQPVHRALR